MTETSPTLSRGLPDIAVFMVEDSRSVSSALTELVESIDGFVVVGVAASETQATEWLWANQGKWEMAFVDLLIENGSGFTLVPRMKRECPACSVVVVSEYVTDVIGKSCLHLGADAVFRKSEYLELVKYLEDWQRTRPFAAGHIAN